MKEDFNSLFFSYRPHADQRQDERLLRDIGLTRTEMGELALAEDPSHLVGPPSPRFGWLHRLYALLASARVRKSLGSSASIAGRSSC
nr:hypothetical protein [uncultured Dongia sp.]